MCDLYVEYAVHFPDILNLRKKYLNFYITKIYSLILFCFLRRPRDFCFTKERPRDFCFTKERPRDFCYKGDPGIFCLQRRDPGISVLHRRPRDFCFLRRPRDFCLLRRVPGISISCGSSLRKVRPSTVVV